jgi:hypothetical protein
MVRCSVCGAFIAQTLLTQLFGSAADEAVHRVEKHHPVLATALGITTSIGFAIAARAVWRALTGKK